MFWISLKKRKRNMEGLIDRHNMEHIEYIDPDDIPRFARIGIVANMHFRHCTFYIDEAVKYSGKVREKYCFNWKSILETGATIGEPVRIFRS